MGWRYRSTLLSYDAACLHATHCAHCAGLLTPVSARCPLLLCHVCSLPCQAGGGAAGGVCGVLRGRHAVQPAGALVGGALGWGWAT